MKIFKRVRNRILRDIYQIPILRSRSDRAYKTAVEKYASNLPPLASIDLDVVDNLIHEGVFVTSLEALKIPSTFQFLQAAKKLIPQIPTTKKNDYVVHASSHQIMQHPEIFFWGLEERLLNIVESYIGLPVAYHGAYFRRDLANQIQRKTRLWHTDIEDPHLLKIIVYLNDVSDEDGPFQYLPKSLSSIAYRSLRYKYGHIRDRTMKRVVNPYHWKSCTGSAGTVIFASTGDILHRGKPPIESDRFTIFFDYTSRQPRFPFYCKSSLPEDDLLLLNPNFSKRQRECVFWRQKSMPDCE